MGSNRVTCDYRCGVFAIAQLFVLYCLLTCGCERKASSTPQMSSPDYDTQREMIEHVIGVKLPESARNCRYDSKSYGFGSGVGWGFFEISRTDLPSLLNESDNLPDATELGQDHVAMENIERAMEQAGENLTWWKPLTLRKRQYASKVLASLRFIGGAADGHLCRRYTR